LADEEKDSGKTEGNERSEFDPLHEDVADTDVVEQSVGVEEGSMFLALDVYLHDGTSKVHQF